MCASLSTASAGPPLSTVNTVPTEKQITTLQDAVKGAAGVPMTTFWYGEQEEARPPPLNPKP